jgi:hypothetical protein
MKYVPRSTFIFCPSGHLVAITNRELGFSDQYGDAFDYMPNQPIPTQGQITNPTCYCGADWFSIPQHNFIERQV